MPRKKCGCPLYCKYCGAKLRKDVVGHYCPSKNCQWSHGAKGCYVPSKKGADHAE
jgi:hypothetical protein